MGEEERKGEGRGGERYRITTPNRVKWGCMSGGTGVFSSCICAFLLAAKRGPGEKKRDGRLFQSY